MDGKTKAEASNVPPEAVQPETDFAEFFYGVISKLYDLKNKQILNDVKSALRDMRRLKHEEDNFHKKTYFSFKPPQVRCAYLYAYSVLHSIMVYSEFSSLLKQSKMFLAPVCRRDSLKICCLGGGPGIEAVAICRSIHDIVLGSLAKSNLNLEVHVTMIDKLPHWRRDESAVVSAMNNSSNILHSESIILHSDFVKADLLKPFEKSLREKIMEADIVTVVKLAVSIQENSAESCDEELQQMIDNVIESMKDDSCLFMLDTAGGKVFYNLVKILKDNKGPHSRLKTSMHKEYNLDESTIKKFQDMMKLKKDPNYRPVLPTWKGKVSACMWVKNITIFSENCDVPKEHNVGETSNITHPVCSTVQSENDASLSTHSGSVLETLNEDTTDATKITVLEKKSKRARKKEMKCKSNKKS